MTVLKITSTAMLLVAVLISCNHNDQQKKTDLSVSPLSSNNQQAIASVETIDLSVYSNAWEQTATQTFTVTSQTTTLLTGKKGLKVSVDPALLEKADGTPVDGVITVKIIEVTTPDELLKSNAATISNGRLLISGGSYYVGMECDGQQVRIKKKHGLQLHFPKIKENEMELFYGNRDVDGNMNWKTADKPLSFDDMMRYTSYNPPYPSWERLPEFKSNYRIYDSLSNKVYFEDKLMSVKNMINILHQKGVDKNIDTIRTTVRHEYSIPGRPNLVYYDTLNRYRIMTCGQVEAEKDSSDRMIIVIRQHQEANRRYNEKWSQFNSSNSFTGQLQKYYAPAEVTQLGWINCDRFYNSPQNTDVPVEIPYTFKNPDVQYFLIYKAFNGLMSGRITKNEKQQYILKDLPQGQAVTLVAFTKTNGQAYHYKEDFVIQRGKVLKPDFKAISAEEMKKMFGANVGI
jgi:hypothetical protein